MEQSKKERQKLIAKISKASGVAQYALEAKMTNEQVIEAADNLEILRLLKAANNYNRYYQGQKTAEANKKSQDFVDNISNNSEIVKAGKWLLTSLSKVGKERKESLLVKGLVHKDDYNDTVTDLKETIEKQVTPPAAELADDNNIDDNVIFQAIANLDESHKTDNYLPIFYLRNQFPSLSRKKLDQALYRLQAADKIDFSTLAEVEAYTREEIDAGIPQVVGGRLFYISRETA